MRLTPKITVRPEATRNSEEALARPFSAWRISPSMRDGSPRAAGSRPRCRAELADHVVGRQVGRAVGVAPIDHRPAAVAQRGAADEGAHRRLVVDGAELDLAGAEDGREAQAAQGADHLLRL